MFNLLSLFSSENKYILHFTGINPGAQDGFTKTDEEAAEVDAYPSDGPLPAATLRSKSTRHVREVGY